MKTVRVYVCRELIYYTQARGAIDVQEQSGEYSGKQGNTDVGRGSTSTGHWSYIYKNDFYSKFRKTCRLVSTILKKQSFAPSVFFYESPREAGADSSTAQSATIRTGK